MATLINMAMSAEEAKEQSQPTQAEDPKYPWGLCLDLDDDSLAKLGLTTMPDVDTEVHLVAKAVVTRTSSYQTQGGESEASLGLQITEMAIANLDSLTADQQLQSLYPSTFGK